MQLYLSFIEEEIKKLYNRLNERNRRLYAGVETLKIGHGGISYIAGDQMNENIKWTNLPPKEIPEKIAYLCQRNSCTQAFIKTLSIAPLPLD